MPFSRQYSRSEVQGMLMIYEGSRPISAIDPATHAITRQRNPAHASIHGGASFADQRTRVNTPGEPRMTGTFQTQDDQIDAALAAINSFQGQIQLRRLDGGETRLGLQAPLPPGRFQISSHHDNSDLGAGVAGHVGRNNAARIGAGSTRQLQTARSAFVLLLKGVGNRLQIQTCYPIA